MTWPVGEPEKERHGPALPAGWYVATHFDEEYWLGVHTGVDLSIPGEADYGAGCYAVADGVVTFRALIPNTTWGIVALIHHPHLGRWSQYAHLSAVDVLMGQAVQQGQRIGAVGNAEGQLAAHLHFEIRRADIPAGKWPSGAAKLRTAAVHAYIRTNYVDPMTVLGRAA